MSQLSYYGKIGGDYSWNSDVTAFDAGTITDANNIGAPGQWDGLGGADLGGTVDTLSSGVDSSLFDNASSILGATGKALGAVSSLANIYLGFQSLKLAKEELGIKKDKWKMAKDELQHMQGTRKHITQTYMA